jgi:hypothetical protein
MDFDRAKEYHPPDTGIRRGTRKTGRTGNINPEIFIF